MDQLQTERTAGVSIKPFSKLKASGSPIPSDRGSKIDKSSEITVAVTGLMKKISHQVEHDNKQTKKEIEKLMIDIETLEQTRKQNRYLLEDLSASLSECLEAEVRLIENEAGRTLYDIATDAGSSQDKFGNSSHSSSKTTAGRRSAHSTDESRSVRRHWKKVQQEGGGGVNEEYQRNGFVSRKRRPHNAAKRDATLQWLLEFGLKRNLPFTEAKRAVDLQSTVFHSISSASSPSRPAHTDKEYTGPRSEASKTADANGDSDSMWRAKIAIMETQSIVSRLGLASLNYCDTIARRSNAVGPTAGVNSEQRQLADEISGYLIDKKFFPNVELSSGAPTSVSSSLPRRREVFSSDIFNAHVAYLRFFRVAARLWIFSLKKAA